jgi:integrase
LPFIFDRSLAKRLLDRAAVLPDSRNVGHRGLTYRVIFALLYGLGLRISELCQLRHGDVDLERDVLLIRRTKFGKTRMVPVGPRVAATLREHLQWHARRFGTATPEAPVFTFDGRHPINRHSINRVFRDLVRGLAVSRPPGVRFPRTHDLRHSFAVGTLLRWYRSGVDPNARLLHLATFLGHVDATSTAVYLTMTPELLHEANRRFESFGLQVVRSGE